MLRKYEIIESKILETNVDKDEILVYINPSEDEKKYLIDKYQIDNHTLLSALDKDELSRLEFEPEHIALIFKRPSRYSSEDELLFKVSSVGIFLFKNTIIIILPEDEPIFNRKQFISVKSLQDILLKIINNSIYHFLEHLKIISILSEQIEDKINTSMENKYLLNMFTLEKSMVYYLNSINSNSMLIKKLRNSSLKIGFTTEDLELIDDMRIENSQCYRQAEIYSNILSSMMDARASIVNNNLNILMKKLNFITISIMVPTLVVSVFSMNVDIPFKSNEFGFWIILGISLISMIIVLILSFWRRV